MATEASTPPNDPAGPMIPEFSRALCFNSSRGTADVRGACTELLGRGVVIDTPSFTRGVSAALLQPAGAMTTPLPGLGLWVLASDLRVSLNSPTIPGALSPGSLRITAALAAPCASRDIGPSEYSPDESNAVPAREAGTLAIEMLVGNADDKPSGLRVSSRSDGMREEP
jgi:hypothetical protein